MYLTSADQADRRGILAVQFENRSGESYRALPGVDRRPDGSWYAIGSASGKVRSATPEEGCSSTGSWSSGGGTGASVGLWLAREDVKVVRITDPAGRTMVDAVSDGVALFVRQGDFSLRASTVEMLDGRGEVLVSRPYHRVARD